MKEIDYSRLRKYSNVPKYDIGTQPISSGYQTNPNQVQVGYSTKNAERITNSFVPNAISSGIQSVSQPLMQIGKDASKYVTTFNKTAADIGEKFGSLAAKQTGEAAQNAVYQEGLKVAKEGAKSAASKAVGAANLALSAYNVLHGGYNMIQNWNDSETLSAGDISNTAARNTEYVNGVAYDTMGGYDVAGVDKYVKDQNKASKIQGAVSGFEAGAGLGSIVGSVVPGLGTILGAGIGGVIGTIGGLFGGNKARRERQRKIEEAKRTYAQAADAYNTQSASEAASEGIRNEFYAKHADKGLSVETKNPNALVQGGEPIVKVDKRGNVIAADMFPITPFTPERVDNIPVKLDKGSTKEGVIGNKIDPYTGERLAVEGRSMVELLNSPYATKEQREWAKTGLRELLNRQNMTNKVAPKHNNGIPMYDYGYAIPAFNYLLNDIDSRARIKAIEKQPIHVNESYAPNRYASQIGQFMPSTVNILPEIQMIDDEASKARYAISQSAYSPGQKMAMLGQLYNNVIKNKSNVVANKQDRENVMRQQYAQMLMQMGESDASRRQQSRSAYNQDKARAYAQKRATLDSINATRRGDLNNMFQTLYNTYWGNKNIGLYREDLDLKGIK